MKIGDFYLDKWIQNNFNVKGSVKSLYKIIEINNDSARIIKLKSGDTHVWPLKNMSKDIQVNNKIISILFGI